MLESIETMDEHCVEYDPTDESSPSTNIIEFNLQLLMNDSIQNNKEVCSNDLNSLEQQISYSSNCNEYIISVLESIEADLKNPDLSRVSSVSNDVSKDDLPKIVDLLLNY